MLARQDLLKIARARLKDAEALVAAGQFDGAVYLCGYAVEIALKARICRQLKWGGFPQSNREFDGLQSFKTHDFKVLIKFTGIEERIRQSFLKEWTSVLDWAPEFRYAQIGSVTSQDAEDMIEAVRLLLGAIR